MSAAVDAFFESYRAEYEGGDAAAISAYFAFPLHVTSDSSDDGEAAGEVVLTHVASRAEWEQQIARLLAAYTKVGVGSARIAALETHPLSPRLFQAVLRWVLHNAQGDELYRFDASYTLARVDGALRITALAHNERPRLQALLALQ